MDNHTQFHTLFGFPFHPFEDYNEGFQNANVSYTSQLPQYLQTQLPATSDEAPPLLNYDDNFRILAPSHQSRTTTTTNHSSVSTPTPVTDQSNSDNDLHRQPSFESKRKSQERDPSRQTKRLKSDKGRAHTARNREIGACLRVR